MKQIKKLRVKYHNQLVGTLSFTPDSRLCVFEYSPEWIASGFSISPLELPLRSGVFIAKPFPFKGNFGIFEDSLPDGYGRYLLRKALLKEGINDNSLTALDRLAIVGEGGMGALTYCPAIEVIRGEEITDFDFLQEKALEVLKEYQDNDAYMLLYNSGN
ncbi:MAG: HipA N-terminal domain-containing protein, partial [Muribaculaceae bacterium]|nr:HipA N-terminal domain-containing protein [Muribaculaceae bacterium]